MPFRKLEKHEGMTTDQLIEQIETKDRRFRLAQTVFMVSTFIALAIVIFIQNQTLHGVQDQLTQAKEVAAEQSKQSDKSDEKIIRRLDCMTVFFSQRNRTNLTIDNIDRCTLNREGNLQEFFTTDENDEPTTTPEEQPPKDQAPNQ